MFVWLCRYWDLIDVLNGIRNAIVPFVGITSSLHLRRWCLCLVDIQFIKGVIINTSNCKAGKSETLTPFRSYRCPTCSRALINMDHSFRILDMEIRRQPMPPPYNSWQSVILCNDCSAKSRVSFHFIGHKCSLYSTLNPEHSRT